MRLSRFGIRYDGASDEFAFSVEKYLTRERGRRFPWNQFTDRAESQFSSCFEIQWKALETCNRRSTAETIRARTLLADLRNFHGLYCVSASSLFFIGAVSNYRSRIKFLN